MRNPIVALAVAAAVALPVVAGAQSALTFDHLKCYKIKDTIKFKAKATLTPEQVQFPTEGCDIVGKGRFLCVPTDKDLTAFTSGNKPPIPQETVVGQVLTDDRICYKVKCPVTQAIPPLDITDQFGTRQIIFGKKAMKLLWVCTPALKQCKDTAGPTCGGFCPTGQACQLDPLGLCSCASQQQYTCQPGITQAPQCNGTCPANAICVSTGNCAGTTIPCLQSSDCQPAGTPCINQTTCGCQSSITVLPCGFAGPPQCYGDCPPGEVCVADAASTSCLCQ